MLNGQHGRLRLSSPTRITVVAAVARGETSPSELARAHGDTVAAMSHHFRTLERERILCLAATRPIRGTVEHLYASTAEGEVVAQLLSSIASAASALGSNSARCAVRSRSTVTARPIATTTRTAPTANASR